jgi:hypothetical protein
MTDKPINMTRPLDLTHEKRNVGPQRIQRPIYVDLLPPCNNACPAGENIQEWLAHAQEGRFKEAWQALTQDNPMPGRPWPGLLSPLRDRLQPQQAGFLGQHPRRRAVPGRSGPAGRLAVP